MSGINSTAKLTSKSQLTVPIAVRKALSVGPDDKLVFTIHEGGNVEVTKAQDAESDPVVEAYLAFLETDMITHPEKLSVLQRDEALDDMLRGVETEDVQ
jgi:antitoxin PrlF